MKKETLILTLDTETYNGLIGKLKRIAVYALGKVYYGYSFADISNVIDNLSKAYDVHIYIHNAEFDIRKIPELFSGDNVVWKKSLFINNKIATLKCRNYTVHDSYKILPDSLDKLSGKKGFDVCHGKVDLWEEVQKEYPDQYTDKVDFLDRCDPDNELFIRYLGYDVISLYEVICKFINVLGIDIDDFVKCPSIASISRFIFKKGYLGVPFKNSDNAKTDYEMLCSYNWLNSHDIEDFIRESYYGGRVEVFKPRLESYGYHYDVNSLYPYVMDFFDKYPIGKPSFTNRPILAQEYYQGWKKNRLGLGFVNCTVYVPDQHIPPLPVKNGKLFFPTGTFYGVWTYEELEYAESECGVIIREYHAACHFDQTYPVFKNFVETFYGLKEKATIEGNASLRTLSKYLLNVGYGYTGMRRDDKTSLDDYKNLKNYDKKDVVFADEKLGYIEVKTDVKAPYIQVAVASYVTSRARLVLLKQMRWVIANSGDVYYCDTDSIVSSIPFDRSIVDKTRLGYWDCESNPVSGLFLKPKVYAELFDNGDLNKKFKGVSRETISRKNFDFYEELYETLMHQDKKYVIVEKNKTVLRGLLWMKKNNIDADYYETRNKKMNVKTKEKRIMDYAGNSTRPIFFDSTESFKKFDFNSFSPEVDYSYTRGGHA